jgi:pyruvate formate-lyase activating enzyme-like uncharacterized protein
MKWLSPDQAVKAEQDRSRILEGMGPALNWSFSGTKPHTGDLSPGCRICGQGTWSCLFVNNLCNARCFYCPTSQDDPGVPGTNTLDFRDPEEYADYVTTFDIQGASFSGGEPMMTLDRVLSFAKVLRRRISRPLHLWMYTNGILVTPDNLKALGDAGIDEIRFDISADGYRLDKAAMAVGVIPTVTVEIPAIPEDMEILKGAARTMADMGVRHLNLHQLRCTGHNKENLIRRGYTFLHGPKVSVLETEQTALRLMAHTLEQGIDLPVNYCSFSFRSQFQSAGIRKRNATLVRAGHESVTESGYLRIMALIGSPETVNTVDRHLAALGRNPELWRMEKSQTRLLFHPSLLEEIPPGGWKIGLTYVATALKPGVTYRYPFSEVTLNPGRSVFIEKKAEIRDWILESDATARFKARYLQETDLCGKAVGASPAPGETANGFEDIDLFERFQGGLAGYF